MKKEECLHDNSSCCTDVDVEINKTWDKFVRQSKKVYTIIEHWFKEPHTVNIFVFGFNLLINCCNITFTNCI